MCEQASFMRKQTIELESTARKMEKYLKIFLENYQREGLKAWDTQKWSKVKCLCCFRLLTILFYFCYQGGSVLDQLQYKLYYIPRNLLNGVRWIDVNSIKTVAVWIPRGKKKEEKAK